MLKPAGGEPAAEPSGFMRRSLMPMLFTHFRAFAAFIMPPEMPVRRVDGALVVILFRQAMISFDIDDAGGQIDCPPTTSRRRDTSVIYLLAGRFYRRAWPAAWGWARASRDGAHYLARVSRRGRRARCRRCHR